MILQVMPCNFAARYTRSFCILENWKDDVTSVITHYAGANNFEACINFLSVDIAIFNNAKCLLLAKFMLRFTLLCYRGIFTDT